MDVRPCCIFWDDEDENTYLPTSIKTMTIMFNVTNIYSTFYIGGEYKGKVISLWKKRFIK